MEKQNFLPGIPILATSHDFPISPALTLEQSHNLDNTGFIRSDKILIMPDRPMPSSSVAIIMTSSNGNISVLLVLCAGNSPVTVESPPPLAKAWDLAMELWCFLWSAPEQTAGQTMETPVIWDAIAVIVT